MQRMSQEGTRFGEEEASTPQSVQALRTPGAYRKRTC